MQSELRQFIRLALSPALWEHTESNWPAPMHSKTTTTALIRTAVILRGGFAVTIMQNVSESDSRLGKIMTGALKPDLDYDNHLSV